MNLFRCMIHKAVVLTTGIVTALGGNIASAAPFDLEVHTGVGNSQGTLVWNISGAEGGPDILSELTYKDIQFVQYGMQSNLTVRQGPLTDYEFFMSFISSTAVSGTVTDSDYHGNQRSDEYSRSESSAENSTMKDFTLGSAHRFSLDRYQHIKPMIAYTYKQQLLLMTEGVQVLDARNPFNIGPFRNTLNSRYETQWHGLWTGAQWGFQTRKHQLKADLKFYWLDYQAEADWNLRSDFAHPKSFEQWALGSGTGIALFYQYNLSNVFSFWLNWSKESWNTDPGQDVVYFADGEIGKTQLNEVKWESTAISTGLVFNF